MLARVAVGKLCRGFRWRVEARPGSVGPNFSREGRSAADLLSSLSRCAKRWLKVADLRVERYSCAWRRVIEDAKVLRGAWGHSNSGE